MRRSALIRALFMSAVLGLLAASPVWAVPLRASDRGCQDSEEPDDSVAHAHELTGPEQRTLYQPFSNDDHDWVYFRASAGSIYQIDARTGDFPTAPVLSLYDANGTLLAQNDHYFGKDAQIWWWNSGPDQKLFIEATEATQRVGCDFYYTLAVVPWNQGGLQTTFGNP